MPKAKQSIPAHFLPENAPEGGWQGCEFITLRPLYPQKPEYPKICLAAVEKLQMEQPKTLEAAIGLVGETLKGPYAKAMKNTLQHHPEWVNHVAQPRPADVNVWPFSRVERYAFGAQIFYEKSTCPLHAASFFLRDNESKYAAFKQEIKEKPVGYYTYMRPQNGYLTNAMIGLEPFESNYILPTPDSEEWNNAKSIAEAAYKKAINPNKTQMVRFKAAYVCFQAMSLWAPWHQGSSTLATITLSHMLKTMGLVLPPQAYGCDVNVQALCSDHDHFMNDVLDGRLYSTSIDVQDIRDLAAEYERMRLGQEYLYQTGKYWSQIISDLHGYGNPETPLCYLPHQKINHLTLLPENDPKRLVPIILDDGAPGLLIQNAAAIREVMQRLNEHRRSPVMLLGCETFPAIVTTENRFIDAAAAQYIVGRLQDANSIAEWRETAQLEAYEVRLNAEKKRLR